MAAKVFLCYRRDDAQLLRAAFKPTGARAGATCCSWMSRRIPLGVNFVTALHEAVTECEVLLAVIGPTGSRREMTPGRRLDDPDDFVRIEIGRPATQHSVIPILLDGAKVPKANSTARGPQRACRA